MTGKLADTVMSVRNGEQLARKYQPVVFNPSTPAQVAQRAKLKMLSQLSAVMAPVIAMPRVGSVSSRNLFTKVNFPETSYETDKASINLALVQLTSSVVALPSVIASRDEANIIANLTSLDVDVDRVVYALFAKNGNSLRYVASAVAKEAGTLAAPWGTELPLVNDEVVVLAYGVRDNNENARTIFGNLQAPTAESVASLIVQRTLTGADITLTRTRGYQLAAASLHAVSPSPEEGNRSSRKKSFPDNVS